MNASTNCAYLVALGLLLSCAGGDGDGSGSDDDDTIVGSGPCSLPSGAEVILESQVIPLTDGSGGAYPYALHSHNDLLYINFYDQIWQVPLAGGAGAEVHRTTRSISLGFKSYTVSDGIALQENGEWSLLPFNGGAAAPSAIDLPNFAFVFDGEGNRLWASVDDNGSSTTSVRQADVGAAAATTVINAQPEGYRSSSWVRSGDRFFVQGGGTDLEIYVYEPGAPNAVPFPVDPAPSLLLGVSPSVLFYLADSFDPDTMGVYYVPLTGGAAQRASDGFITTATPRHRSGSALYINDATALWRLGDDKTVNKISQVPAGACTTNTVLAHEGYVYTATNDSASGETVVWRVAE